MTPERSDQPLDSSKFQNAPSKFSHNHSRVKSTLLGKQQSPVQVQPKQEKAAGLRTKHASPRGECSNASVMEDTKSKVSY